MSPAFRQLITQIVMSSIFVLFTSFIFINKNLLIAQCTNTQFGSAYSLSDFNDTLTISMNGSRYYLLSNIKNNKSYQFISSGGISDRFTIRPENITDPEYISGISPVIYNSGINPEVVSVHLNLDSGCGQNITRQVKIVCTDCTEISPKAGVNITKPSATWEIGGEIKIGKEGRPPQAGMIRWNQTAKDFEGFDGNKWVSFTKSNSNSGTWGEASTLVTQENELFNAFSAGDFTGRSVAISGDYAASGSPGSDIIFSIFPYIINQNQGLVNIYHFDNNKWNNQSILYDNLVGTANDNFGTSVDIHEDDLIIGAPGAETYGAVYFYKRQGTEWVLQSKLTASDASPSTEFGRSVGIWGDYAIVGAPRKNSSKGGVYIFHRSGSTWQEIMAINGETNGDDFGRSVSITDQYFLVGAPQKESQNGAAYFYYFNTNGWVPMTVEIDNFNAPGYQFGCSVSISGTKAVVCSPVGLSNGIFKGAAHVYTLSGSTISVKELLIYNEKEYEYAYDNVDTDGFSTLIGSPDKGESYVYDSNSIKTGTLISSIPSETMLLGPNNGTTSSLFGAFVAISNNKIIIGAPGFSNTSYDHGAVHFFNRY